MIRFISLTSFHSHHFIHKKRWWVILKENGAEKLLSAFVARRDKAAMDRFRSRARSEEAEETEAEETEAKNAEVENDGVKNDKAES